MDNTIRQTLAVQPDDAPPSYTMRPDHCINDYRRGVPRLINILSEADGRNMAALTLSFDLVAKMRVAICCGYEYRHSENILMKARKRQETIDIELRLVEVEIEGLQVLMKAGTTLEQQKDCQAKLLDAFKKQKELQRELRELEDRRVPLETNITHARHSFESKWAAIDSNIRFAFENGGFKIEPSNSCVKSNDPPQPKGYSANDVYASHGKLQCFLPQLVNLAGEEFKKARMDFHDWHHAFNVEAEKAAAYEDHPYETGKDQAKFKALWRMEWHEENAVCAQKRTSARERYQEAYKTAKLWKIDDVASWPSETWVSMGPEEENRHALESRDLTRTRNWINSLVYVAPDTSEMTPWAGPKFPITHDMAHTDPFVPDSSDYDHEDTDTKLRATVFPSDSISCNSRLWYYSPSSVASDEHCSIDSRMFELFHQDHNRRDEVKNRYGYFEQRLNYGAPLGCAQLTRYNLEKHTKNYRVETPVEAAQPGVQPVDAVDTPDENAAKVIPQPRQQVTKKVQLQAYNAQRKAKEASKSHTGGRPMIPDMDLRCPPRIADIQELLKRKDEQKERDKRRGITTEDSSEDRSYMDAWLDAGSETYVHRCEMRRTDYRRRLNYMGREERNRWEGFMGISKRRKRTKRDRARTPEGSPGSEILAFYAKIFGDDKGAHEEKAHPVGTTDQKESVATPGPGIDQLAEGPSASDPNHPTAPPSQHNQDQHDEPPKLTSAPNTDRGLAPDGPPESENNSDHNATEISTKSFALEGAMVIAEENGPTPNQPPNIPTATTTESPPIEDHQQGQSGGSRPHNPNPSEREDELEKRGPVAKRKRADHDEGHEFAPRRNVKARISALESSTYTQHGRMPPRSRKLPPNTRSGGFTRALFTQPLLGDSPEVMIHRTIVPSYDGFANIPTPMDIDSEYDEEL